MQDTTATSLVWFCIVNMTIVLIIYLVKEPEELFETISQALLSSVDRDCLSGWGGYVLIV